MSQQAYLKASNTEAGDEFAVHVSISDDTIIAGALFEDGKCRWHKWG
ncbi:MAG: FG-GAP repeat protein [Anaerolineales bacterium]|nr:FG-GAP repeat protein [Anaerolineales bacterium]